MALHGTGAKIGMSIVLFFQFAGWVVALGGTANATQECREDTDDWGGANRAANEGGHLQKFPDMPGFGTQVDEERAYDCGQHFSLDWWIIAFQIFLIIYGYLAVFVEVFHSKHSVMNMYAIATALFTLYTSIYTKLGYAFGGGSHSDNKVAQGYKTALAGGVIVCVCNYIFMFVFGSEEEGGADATPPEKA